MSGHTPGPWQSFEKSAGGSFFISKMANAGWIAEVGPHPIGNHDELAANARLIAQTPDLRAFAEQIARLLLDGEDEGEGIAYEQEASDAIDTLASLIEKARALTGIEGPGKPVCSHFQSDGRGCCINCGHFHGPEDRA